MHIYIRVVKAKGALPYKVQLSPDRLRWVVMGEYDEFDPAKTHAENLDKSTSPNQPQLELTHILWKNK